jgi:copper transport protein
MTRSGSRRLLVLAAATVAVIAGGGAAQAHALRQSSFPDAGAALAQAPSEVRVTFGEQPDPGLSSLRVLDTAGHDDTAGPTQPVPGQPLTLRVSVRPLPNGVYTVAWRTVSRVDGHIAAGTFSFGVGVSPTGTAAPAATAARAPGPSLANVAARWLLYLGLMLLVGGAVVGLGCFPELTGPFLALLAGGAVVGSAGAAGVAWDQLRSAGLPLSRLFDSPFSHPLLARLLPAAAAGLIVVAVAVVERRRLRRTGVALAGLLGVVAMWGDVEASHVAAAPTWRLGRMALQCLHFAAAGVWVGGLVTLLVGLRRTGPDERARPVRRFSTLALGAVVVLAATGLQRAFDEVGSIHRLVTATFGRYVLLKAGLLVVLVVLGALNRYRAVPAAGRTLRPLRRLARTELAVVAVVLVATGFLQGLAPPASVAAPTAVRPLVLTGHDAGTTVKAELDVSPGTAGFNQFRLTVRDYDSGAPVDAPAVTLRFLLPARPDLGESTLALPSTGPGTYTASGANLSIDGTWAVTVAVQRATGGVEIPLTLTTRQPPEQIDVQRYVGAPTLYTLHLPEGRSIQVYLDPGKAGVPVNEFHVTVVGPDSTELAVRDLTVSATPPGKTVASPLPVRRLDPLGHFVADVAGTTTGSYGFDVNATAATGEQLQGHFTVVTSG